MLKEERLDSHVQHQKRFLRSTAQPLINRAVGVLVDLPKTSGTDR